MNNWNDARLRWCGWQGKRAAAPHYKAIFEYHYERQPAASQRVLYLGQITDLTDRFSEGRFGEP